jgi:peptidoglycan/xylan/chitin deacetylase (PgdA/CDA1 family)
VRRAATVTLTAGVAGTATWALPAPAAHVPPLCDALGISRRAALGPGAVGLTFDDGPHPRGTPAVLEALDRAGATATFFVVGEQVRRDPGLVREVVAAGHRLGVHGDRHRSLLRMAPRTLRADLDRCSALVEELSGAPVSLYRPPYGIFSTGGLLEIRSRGWRPLLWSRWGRDWRQRATASQIADDVSSGCVAGDVILLHDADHYSTPGSWRCTVDALPGILGWLGKHGLRAVAV